MSLFHSIISGLFQTVIENLVIILWSIMGMIVMATAAYFTFKSYRLHKSKSNQKPDLVLTLYHQIIRDHIYFLIPFLENTTYTLPLSILITNKGDVSAKNVELFAEIPDEYYQKDLERSSPIADARKMTRASDEGRSEHIAYLYMRIGDIPPKSTIKTTDYIFARKPTVHKFQVPVTSKDGINFTRTVNAAYSILLTFQVLCENEVPIKRTYQLHYRKGNKDEIEKFLLEEKKLLDKNVLEDLDGITPIAILHFNKSNKVPRPNDTPSSVTVNVLEAGQNSFEILDGCING